MSIANVSPTCSSSLSSLLGVSKSLLTNTRLRNALVGAFSADGFLHLMSVDSPEGQPGPQCDPRFPAYRFRRYRLALPGQVRQPANW